MIKTSTYLENESQIRSLLASFTPLDKSITENLNEEEISNHYNNLLLRLSTLCYYHGFSTPDALIEEIQGNDREDLFNIINSYLEIGKYDENDEYVKRRELQQEMVHFSRIVDINSENKEIDSDLNIYNKRLKKSKFLPDSLKVLTEIMTVVRSRHLSRGENIPLPINGHRKIENIKNDGNITVQYDDLNNDYILVIASERQRQRREISYLYKFLLEYLTPLESALALGTYLTELDLNRNVGFYLVERVTEDTFNTIEWDNRTPENLDSEEWVKSSIPKVQLLNKESLSNTMDKLFDSLNKDIQSSFDIKNDNVKIQFYEVNSDAFIVDTKLHFDLQRNNDVDLKSHVEELVKESNLNHVISIECGHIHLDRELDIDQDHGMEIGYQVSKYLSEIQDNKPTLTPMVDDDHVIVQLSPKEYDKYFKEKIKGEKYELIPESSPVIRAILVALFDNMSNSSISNRLVLGGDNLYLEVDEFTTCELFEDFNGWCDNGCAFFELGLLIFRSAPDYFLDYVNDRFNLNFDLHENIFSILDEDISHNSKVDKIKSLYSLFNEVTDPHNPDNEFKEHVFNFLNKQTENLVHVNVLEDYYEVQQNKVRSMVELLELPLTIKSIHFNTSTSRLVLK